MFLFATLPAISKDGALSPLYFRAREFSNHLPAFRTIEAKSTQRRQFEGLTETLEGVSTVSLLSD